MVEGADDRPSIGWRLHRRQLLGGGLLGAAGAALAPLVSPTARSGGPAAAQPASDVLAAGSTRGGTDRPRAPDALRTAGLAAPLGLGVDDVFFSWQLRDPRRGARQQAYRVVVSGPVVGSGSAPVVWDSGKVISSDQASVPYAGPALAPDTAYRWTVQTWDASGRAGPTAAVATFETGLAGRGWTASWIRRVESETEEPDQYTYARREFVLGVGAIDRARAYVSGDQQYELYVNGERAGKGQAYSYPDSKYYEALDLTRLLRPGSVNAVGILSNWQGPTKGHPAGEPGVVAEIVVHRRHGRVERVVTDGSWRVARGAWLPGTQRDLEGDLVDFTENIDGPAQPVGWDRAGLRRQRLGPRRGAGPRADGAMDPPGPGADPHRRGAGAGGLPHHPVLGSPGGRLREGLRRRAHRPVPPRRGRPPGDHAGRIPAGPAGGRTTVRRCAGPGLGGARHPAHRHELHLRAARRGGAVPSLRLPGLPLLPDRRPRGGPAARGTWWRWPAIRPCPTRPRPPSRRPRPPSTPSSNWAPTRPSTPPRSSTSTPRPGRRAPGCSTASTSPGRRWRRSGSRTSPASPWWSSASPRSGTGPTGPSTRSTRPVWAPSTSTSRRRPTSSGYGSTGCTAVTGPWSGRSTGWCRTSPTMCSGPSPPTPDW